MKTKLLYLILFVNHIAVYAQLVYPLNIQILLKQNLTRPSGNSFNIDVVGTFNRFNEIPDYINVNTNSIDTYPVQLSQIIYNDDSTVTGIYHEIIEPFLGHSFYLKPDSDYRFSGINIKSDYLFSCNSHASTIGYATPSFIYDKINLMPGELFTGGFYSGTNNMIKDSISFEKLISPNGSNGYFTKYDTSIYVNPNIGIISWRVPSKVGLYQYASTINYEYCHQYAQHIIVFEIDTAVKSSFNIDNNNLDKFGITHIPVEKSKYRNFKFNFIDPFADSNKISWFSTLDKLDSIPIISNISKSIIGDTTFFNLELNITGKYYARLPGAINILIRSYKKNRKVQNRLFSFAIDDISKTGIEQQTIEQDFQVYPNPASDFIQIYGAYKGSIFTLYNSLGQMQLSTNKERIEISHLPASVYYLSIQDKISNRIKNVRFIKN